MIEEVRAIIAFVEAMTGLASRWNGGLLTLADGTNEAWTAQSLPRVSYRAKKEWNCSITVLESVLQDEQRWRTLLHECLHSVSVGLTEPNYQQFAPWEEAVIESLQRLYRPLLFQYLRIDPNEEQFCEREAMWHDENAVNALATIAAMQPEVPLSEFLEALLRTSLPERPAYAFTWGRQSADFNQFKRVYAAASSYLR